MFGCLGGCGEGYGEEVKGFEEGLEAVNGGIRNADARLECRHTGNAHEWGGGLLVKFSEPSHW